MWLCKTHHNLISKHICIKGMHGLTQFEHHEVRNIYNVIDRSHPTRLESTLKPTRRCLHMDPFHRHGHIPRAQIRILNRYVKSHPFPRSNRLRFIHIQRSLREGRDLSRHSIMPHQIRTIGQRFMFNIKNNVIHFKRLC